MKILHSSVVIPFLCLGLFGECEAEKPITPVNQEKANEATQESAASSAVSDVSKASAAKAMRAWQAFECSVLAEVADDRKKQEAFFLQGLKEGKAFLEALEAKKITVEDLNSQAPIAVILLSRGPSHDFILGRIYSSAEREVLKDILSLETKEEQANEARKQLSLRNSDLILER